MNSDRRVGFMKAGVGGLPAYSGYLIFSKIAIFKILSDIETP